MTDYEIDNLWMHRTDIHNGELMPQLRDFARAAIKDAVAAEREACAKVLENGAFLHTTSPEAIWATQVAKLIRARGAAHD